jgi:hypothetical protein
LGVLGFNASAIADPVVLAPLPGLGPTVTVVNPDLTPKLDTLGNPQTTPQVGTLLLAGPGTWNDMAGTTFKYQWATYNPTTLVTTNVSGSTGTAKDYVPIAGNVGFDIKVTVTATNTANGDTSASAAVLSASTAVGLNPAVTVAPTSGQPYTTWFGSTPSYTTAAWLTNYGYPDNTPPSAGIAAAVSGGSNITFPNNVVGKGIHTLAGGTGTYSDPITFATSSNEVWYGTEIYVPRFHKYFIGEDSCSECSSDMRGASPNNPDGTIGPGPDGGPGFIHFDLWVGGQNADWPNVILCEDANTLSNADGTPYMDPIIVNPGPSEVVDTTPIYDPATGKCNTQPDGSSTPLGASLDVGSYQNVPAPAGATGTPDGTGLCITDPGNSTTVGTQLTMQDCDSSRADQNLSFAGAFLIFNNLCIDMGNGLGGSSTGDTSSLRRVSLQLCNLNAKQQWELNYSGTITDIQSSGWALADNGTGVLVAVKNSNFAYNYWSFPFLRGASNTATVAVDPSSIHPGSTLHVTGSGLTTPTAEIRLVSAADPAGVLLGTVTAAADGTFDAMVTVPSSPFSGTYQVKVQGLTDVVPDGTAITLQSQLQYGTLVNFAPVNRTAPITGESQTFSSQAITFDPLPGRTYGDADFDVAASASSGLAVSFSDAGDCTVTGSTVHIISAGSCTITASQQGDSNWLPADDVAQTFTINKATPAITWSAPAGITYGTALSATQLDASTSVKGTFVYSPDFGTILDAGLGQRLSVTFTPDDTANYPTETASVSIEVGPKGLTVTASNNSKTCGTSLTLGTSAFTTSGLVNSDTVTSVTLTSAGAAASATVAGSPYAIVPSAAVGSGLSNYTITYANGSLTVTPAALKTLVVSGLTTPRTAGSTGSIRVTAVDAYGNRIHSYLGTVHFTSTDAKAKLPASYTFTAADAGTHVFSVTLKTAGTQSVTATDKVTASIKGAQAGIVVTPAALKTLVVSGLTTPRTAGSTGSIRVTAVDAYGNRIHGYLGTVHFTSSDAKAGLPANYKFTAADAGTHVFSVTLKTAGTQSVTATDKVTASIKGAQAGIVVE